MPKPLCLTDYQSIHARALTAKTRVLWSDDSLKAPRSERRLQGCVFYSPNLPMLLDPPPTKQLSKMLGPSLPSQERFPACK